jgi:predicted amidohydrolase
VFGACCLVACGEQEPRVIRLAVVQTAGVPGSVAANADHADKLVRDAAARGARYILLPELYAFFPAARAQAGKEAIHREAVESADLFTQRMVALASELGVNIAFGTPELRDGRLYNALVFVEPTGVTGSYAKRYLLKFGPEGSREVEVFATGPAVGTFEWGGVRVGPIICSDGGAGPLWERMMEDGAQIMLWASSGPRLQNLPSPVSKRRPFEARIPVAYANRTRPEELYPGIYGGSQIIDGSGTVLAEANVEVDAVLVADVPLPRS